MNSSKFRAMSTNTYFSWTWPSHHVRSLKPHATHASNHDHQCQRVEYQP